MVKVESRKFKLCVKHLEVGQNILLSGKIFTARDQAHARIAKMIEKCEKLPFEIENSVIYYTGPSPTPQGEVIGSCGPTTSQRMDRFAPKFYELGMVASIGKGDRSHEVYQTISKNRGVYFAAFGGAGALYAKCVKSVRNIAFEDLGTESVKEICVENMPLVVAIDSNGKSIFKNKLKKI